MTKAGESPVDSAKKRSRAELSAESGFILLDDINDCL